MDDGGDVVAVVGQDPDRKALVTSLESAKASVREVDPTADHHSAFAPIAVVVLDEESLRWVARSSLSAPVLAVDTGPAFASHARSEAGAALERLLAGSAPTTEEPILTVDVDGQPPATAFFEVVLTTSEPAKISEFSVATASRPVTSFRADGIVAATPAGSAGYARAAGGPVLGPGSDCLAVVPIAPFRTHRDRWVLALESRPALTVERDEEPVSLVIDGHDAGEIPPGTPVELERRGSLPLALSPQ